MPSLRDDAQPMHLMSASADLKADEVRFLFYYPDDKLPDDWRRGYGAMLFVSSPRIFVPGDQDNPEYELPLSKLAEYTDKLTGSRGIPCGIGFSKNEAQIVDYDGPEWMFRIKAQTYWYHSNVKIHIKDEQENTAEDNKGEL